MELFILDGQYYWRVQAKDAGIGGNVSSWNISWGFKVDIPPPEVPLLHTPSYGSILTDKLVFFNWTGIAGLSYSNPIYKFQIASNPSFLDHTEYSTEETDLALTLSYGTYF